MNNDITVEKCLVELAGKVQEVVDSFPQSPTPASEGQSFMAWYPSLPNTNLNNVVNIGTYRLNVSNITNLPPETGLQISAAANQNAVLEVVSTGGNSLVQTLTHQNRRIFSRARNNTNVWTGWTELPNEVVNVVGQIKNISTGSVEDGSNSMVLIGNSEQTGSNSFRWTNPTWVKLNDLGSIIGGGGSGEGGGASCNCNLTQMLKGATHDSSVSCCDHVITLGWNSSHAAKEAKRVSWSELGSQIGSLMSGMGGSNMSFSEGWWGSSNPAGIVVSESESSASGGVAFMRWDDFAERMGGGESLANLSHVTEGSGHILVDNNGNGKSWSKRIMGSQVRVDWASQPWNTSMEIAVAIGSQHNMVIASVDLQTFAEALKPWL